MADPDDRSVDLPVPVDAAFDATCRALAELGWAISQADRAAGIVEARVPPAGIDGVALYLQPVTATSSTVIVRPPPASGARLRPRAVDELIDAVRRQAGTDRSSLPPPPDPTASVHAAGWYADPSGRHEFRWWNGTQWTDAVSTAGVQATDPVGR